MKQLIIVLITLLGACCSILGQTTAEIPQDRIAISQLTDRLYVVTCFGGEEWGQATFGINTIASVGEDGILLVDAGFGATGEKLRDTLKTLGNGNLRIVVNTHGHGDHAFGNRFLADQSVIIAHRNVFSGMSGEYFHLPKLPSPNRPMVAFDDSLVIHFNGEDIHIVHTPDCHSAGDAYVHFTGSKVVAVGDLLFPDAIPYVGLNEGATVDNYHNQVKRFIDEFPDDVNFTASHGRTSYNKDDLRAYYTMLDGTKKAVRETAAAGKTADEMVNENLLADWAKWDGQFPTTSLESWIRSVYADMQAAAQPAPSICEPLTAKLVKGTVQDAVAEYHRLKSQSPEDYDFGEVHLNMLGYQLLFRNCAGDASEIFRLNMEVFPNSFNVYDSYGEALMILGDTAQSIVNYEKSLELNPENANAVEMLKGLKGARSPVTHSPRRL